MTEPWIEKYRPTKLSEIVLSEQNKKIIDNMISKDTYPNIIFYGPPGTGKTTTILCLIKEYQNKHKCKNNYIHLNASHQRGIDVIRNQIYEFTQNKNFFDNKRKFILLDEIDSMTKQAQHNLYYVIQKCKKSNITFILICNYLNKIINTIRESLLILHFNKTTLFCDKFIKKCIKNESIHIPKQKLNLLKKNNIHDLRSIINHIQNYDNTDYIISHVDFEKILKQPNYDKKIKKLLVNCDDYSFMCMFFQYLYDTYDILDDEILYNIKLLLIENNDINYLIKEFIPLIKHKIKID